MSAGPGRRSACSGSWRRRRQIWPNSWWRPAPARAPRQGAVRVVMSGTQECHRVVIDPELLAQGDAARLQDLVLLAVNQAIKDSQLLAARRLSPLAGDLDQPE